LVGRELVINLHGIGEPDRLLEPGEKDSIIDVSMLEYVLELVAENSATVTVDDGNMSDVEIILPNLKKRKLKAIFFIPAAKIGKQGYLARGDVVALQQEGMVVGSHGMGHVNWRQLDNHELECELVESKRILEDIIDSSVTNTACPFGAYDRRVLQFIRKAGYKKVYTSDRGRANPDNWVISRNSLCAKDTADSIDRLIEGEFSFFEQSLISLKKTVKRWR